MEIDKGLKSTIVADNGPKLTSATKLNSSVSANSRTEPPAVAGALKEAVSNNREAAEDIVKVTDQSTSDVEKENRIAARISPAEVDNFTDKLQNKILQSPDMAMNAVKNINEAVVRGLLG